MLVDTAVPVELHAAAVEQTHVFDCAQESCVVWVMGKSLLPGRAIAASQSAG